MKLLADLRAGWQELKLRWKEPLNTFWHRALVIFGILGAGSAFLTEIIVPILLNPEASTELKEYLRPFYTYLIGIASAAKVTTANYEAFKEKKAQEEFKQKLNV